MPHDLSGTVGHGLAVPVVAALGLREVRRATMPVAAGAVLSAALLAATRAPVAAPWLHELWRSGLLPLGLSACLIALAGLSAAWLMAWARQRAVATAVPAPALSRWGRGVRAGQAGDALLVSRMAGVPQVALSAPLAVVAAAAAWWWHAALAGAAGSPDLCFAVAGAALALAFPLLVADRALAAVAQDALPEADALRRLMQVPLFTLPVLAGLEIAAGLGQPAPGLAGRILAVLLVLIAAEVALRAALRLFLPPPAPAEATVAARSLLAGLLVAGTRRGGLATPLREHFGIDFARSWALAYVGRALPAVAATLSLLVWGLSGVVLVKLDQRGVYERLGAPVALLHPGAHLVLPWPLGRVRWLEYGTVHELALGSADPAAASAAAIGAEAVPPASVDRLWTQEHPAEAMLLIASTQAGQQGFQAVSLDLRVLWRAAMDDAGAQRFAYRSADPEILVRAAAGRAAADYFAARTLGDVLGENRTVLATHLRAAAQSRLDGFAAGIDIVATVVEAIHPPAGAADAYHSVQASEIAARTSVDAERGRAQGVRAAALQTANETRNAALASAAEDGGTARADGLRFTADRDAAAVGGPAFPVERYFAALTGALAKAPLTILDHRIAASDAPVMDIRPPGQVTTTTGAGGD